MNEQEQRIEENVRRDETGRDAWSAPIVESFAARDVYSVLATTPCGESGSVSLGGEDCTSA
ncbi:MAG: hypothetical protein H6747_06985 [Deltaproteobacteria bacterium]|nr:hypothetical protein [Deltaproteobacteria bacterium]